MSTIIPTRPVVPDLPLPQLHLMHAGYLLMGVGLAVVKWPLIADVSTMPLCEGVTLSMLTAMSLLALLGQRYRVTMLPVLLFESASMLRRLLERH